MVPTSPFKLQVQMVIYIQYKFHEISSIGYLVMAEDGKTGGKMDRRKDRRVDGQHQNLYPSALGGG